MFKKILVPTDFSDCSRKAVDAALVLADKLGAELTLLHASNAVDHESFMDRDLMRKLSDLLELESSRMQEVARTELNALVKSGEANLAPEQVDYRVVFGSPATVVLQVAEEIAPDLIVMGTHGRSTLQDVIMGSTTERVARRAPCAVLMVKPDGYPFWRD